MTEISGAIHSTTEGGIAAEHPAVPLPKVRVAPTTADNHNTLKLPLIPFACWRADDIRFEFDSSFVLPAIEVELRALKALLDQHTLPDQSGSPNCKPLLSVFGHADPVGKDDYNKKLSGRRAAAVYAMLTRNTDLWEDIYSQTAKFTAPLSGDAWGLNVIQRILQDLGYTPGPVDGQMGDQTREALKSFQRDHPPMRDDGDPGAQTRARLFLEYMDRHCRDVNDQPYKVEKTDFLGLGADQAGKGDFQGCGECNPVLMFSSEENRLFQQAQNRTERDAANAPNRRVVIFLFRPGTAISLQNWPCSRAKDGVEKCQKRFWSDSRERRQFQELRRDYRDTKDTFACRFYDRLAGASPCERIVDLATVRIRLFDTFEHPIPHAPYQLTVGEQTFRGSADDYGFVIARVQSVPETCCVKWSRVRPDDVAPSQTEDPADEFEFELEAFLKIGDSNDEEAMRRRLHNLAYPADLPLAENVQAFQRKYSLRETGNLEDIKGFVLKWHDVSFREGEQLFADLLGPMSSSPSDSQSLA